MSRLKRFLIAGYCSGWIPGFVVRIAFKLIPQLKDA